MEEMVVMKECTEKGLRHAKIESERWGTVAGAGSRRRQKAQRQLVAVSEERAMVEASLVATASTRWHWLTEKTTGATVGWCIAGHGDVGCSE